MINKIFFLLLFSSSIRLSSQALFHKRVPSFAIHSPLNYQVRVASYDFFRTNNVIQLKALAYEIDTFINAYEIEDNNTETEELKDVLKHNVKVNLHYHLTIKENRYFSELDLCMDKTLRKITKTENKSEIELLIEQGLKEIDEFNLPIQSCTDEDITPEKTAAYKENLKNEFRKNATKKRPSGLFSLLIKLSQWV